MGLGQILGCRERISQRLNGYIGHRVDQHDLREARGVALIDVLDLLD